MRQLGRNGFVLLAFGVVGCDHTTKHLVQSSLALGQSRELIAGVLDIRHVLNTDTAFSVLGDVIPLTQRLLLLRLTAWLGVFVVGLFIIGRWKRASSVERLGWALVLGGALGNALDRLIRGSVVDFIYVHYWPVFNVADIAITSGVALMILVTRRRAAVGRNA